VRQAAGGRLHGTAVAIDGHGVLIAGPSGSGKSDLAMRLIDRGARLVADDQVLVHVEDDVPILSAPDRLAGLIEVRGLGIVRWPTVGHVALTLWVDLRQEDRMPEPQQRRVVGLLVPRISVDPRPASAPIKVEWAVRGVEVIR